MCRFLIADLGILRYPQYVVRRTRAVWPDRHSLLAYEAALRHAEALDTALEVPARLCLIRSACVSCHVMCSMTHSSQTGVSS